MSNFFIPYAGGKSKELKEFVHLIDYDKFDTIVEPFGGSLAFSRHVYKQYPNKEYLCADIDGSFFMKQLFKNKIIHEYSKLYQMTKKTVTHIVVSNIKNENEDTQ
jgi:site-specific DNA-adenine methylase